MVAGESRGGYGKEVGRGKKEEGVVVARERRGGRDRGVGKMRRCGRGARERKVMW